MKVFYDTEFLEDGRTIDLISIGMVRADGEELYLINRGVDLRRLAQHEWLMANVVPHLPLTRTTGHFVKPDGVTHTLPVLAWDVGHTDWPRVRSRVEIANAVRRYLIGNLRPLPELWAWYGAYDHIALAQLFGPMVKLPDGIPMWTNDLRQLVEMAGGSEVGLNPPAQQGGEHHALADARWVRDVHAHLSSMEADGALRWSLLR